MYVYIFIHIYACVCVYGGDDSKGTWSGVTHNLSLTLTHSLSFLLPSLYLNLFSSNNFNKRSLSYTKTIVNI